MDSFKELSEDTQKLYAEIVKTNMNAMSGIMILMMNQSQALAKGDLNLASSAVVQTMLIAIDKLIASLLKDGDYQQAVIRCADFFMSLVDEDLLEELAKKKEATNDSNS